MFPSQFDFKLTGIVHLYCTQLDWRPLAWQRCKLVGRGANAVFVNNMIVALLNGLLVCSLGVARQTSPNSRICIRTRFNWRVSDSIRLSIVPTIFADVRVCSYTDRAAGTYIVQGTVACSNRPLVAPLVFALTARCCATRRRRHARRDAAIRRRDLVRHRHRGTVCSLLFVFVVVVVCRFLVLLVL